MELAYRRVLGSSTLRANAWMGAPLLVLSFSGILLTARLDSFGIWDPWELRAADRAGEVGALGANRLAAPDMIALGFKLFGVHEWGGRLPMALAGFLTTLLAFLMVTRFADLKTGCYAAVICASNPLLVFN